MCVHPSTDNRQLPSDEAAELGRAGPGVEVPILPHHSGKGLFRPQSSTLAFIFFIVAVLNPLPLQALTKFLKCVNWDLPQEAKQALELLGKWRPMDVEDSLELLSSQFANPTVRRYAVARLQQADDEVVREEERSIGSSKL